MSAPSYHDPTADNVGSTYVAQPTVVTEASRVTIAEPQAPPREEHTPPLLPSASKTEKFLLTAADQESGSRDERLNRVIRSKYEAGLLKPYDYVKGYARLSRWMDRKYVVIPSWSKRDIFLTNRSQRFATIETTNSATSICSSTQVQSE